jgi:hypothetical protein
VKEWTDRRAALHGFVHHIAPRVAKNGVTINGTRTISIPLRDNNGASAGSGDDNVLWRIMFSGDKHKEVIRSHVLI